MDDNEFNLRDIFGLLRRQARLIGATMLVVATIAALVAVSLTPTYTASALVLVDPSQKDLLAPTDQAGAADSARIDSEVELARSDSVLLRAVRAEGLAADPEFGAYQNAWQKLWTALRPGDTPMLTDEDATSLALSRLRSAVSIQRRGLTYIIAVQVRSEDGIRAAITANAVADAYIAEQLASKVNSILVSLDMLQARVREARSAMTTAGADLDRYVDQTMQTLIGDGAHPGLMQLQRRVDLLRAQEIETRQAIEAASSGTMAGAMTTPQTPQASALQQALEQVHLDLAQAESSLRQAVLASPLPAPVLTEVYELQQAAQLAQAQYETLLARAQELETQAELQLADSRVVSAALPADRPSFPNHSLIAALAALFGLALGVAFAFLRENLVGGFTSDAQVESVLRQPVAAAIPRERTKSERESLADLMVNSPLSRFAESIRRIRAVLEIGAAPIGGKEGGSRVVLVTSTAASEGKTTTALALARSYALAGHRTLLIDCDLRKPGVHHHLDYEPSTGLLDFLSTPGGAEVSVHAIVSKDELTQMTLIVGSRRSEMPTDQLLAGPAFGRLIGAARNAFDVIVLDSPPLGSVVDGRYIARFADAVVFVLRWAATSQTHARRAIADLVDARTNAAGIVVVLNQQDASRRPYGSDYTRG